MSSNASEGISPAPGFIRSFFIHLAGADPRAFIHLPTTEASEYVKLGVSVLVPVALALAAGTFTLAHLQDPDHPNWTMAMIGGVVWAAVILIIDVAVMSQISKDAPPPPAAAPAASAAPSRSRNYARPEAEATAAPVAPPRRRSRNGVIAVLRIGIAVVLGLLVSDSLMLEMFKKKIGQRLEDDRRAAISTQGFKDATAKKDKLQQRRDELEKVRTEQDPTRFREQYQRVLGLSAAPGATPDDTSDQEDRVLADLLKDRDADAKRQEVQLAGPTERAKATRTELEQLKRDRTTAKTMLEVEGHPNQYPNAQSTWKLETLEYKDAIGGDFTTGRDGSGNQAKGKKHQDDQAKGHRYHEIEAGIAKMEPRIQEDQKKLDEQETIINGINNNHIQTQKDIADQISKRKKTISDQKTDDARVRREGDQKRDQTSRDNLDKEFAATEAELNKAKADESLGLAKYQGGEDIMERTAALVKIVFTPQNSEDMTVQRPVLIGLIIVVELSLILIDLTPLLMKLLKPPGVYDQYLQAMRTAGFRLPTPAAGIPAAIPPPETNGLRQTPVRPAPAPGRVAGSPPPRYNPNAPR